MECVRAEPQAAFAVDEQRAPIGDRPREREFFRWLTGPEGDE
jgi:hypothetical protein